jgi:D-glycero-D-manno-heptose 1,7-bisphosphate phosphatase
MIDHAGHPHNHPTYITTSGTAVTRRPALFLDRDGIINVDHDYVHRREDFEFIDGIFELCRHAKSLEYRIFVITNQAGIGRGYYSEQDFQALTDWMCGVFREEQAAIDMVYFCPFHPDHGIGQYKVNSPFRKPGPGMILLAAKEYDVNLAGSVLLGDRETDVQAGIAAGVGTNLLMRPAVTAQAAALGYRFVSDYKTVEQILSDRYREQ